MAKIVEFDSCPYCRGWGVTSMQGDVCKVCKGLGKIPKEKVDKGLSRLMSDVLFGIASYKPRKDLEDARKKRLHS